MTGILAGVDQRTRMVGENRLELLLFRLADSQRFGINVFKVQEVIQCPSLVHLPKSHAAVRGVAHLRGKTIPIIDLAMAIGQAPLGDEKGKFVIITEYNRSTQGFLVHSVDQIVDKNWAEIKSPPAGIGHRDYLTSVTQIDKELVEIIDVEQVLADINRVSTDVSQELASKAGAASATPRKILIADDSSVARKQIYRALQSLGFEIVQMKDGREALQHLRELADQGIRADQEYHLLVSDIEMPNMDGYTLTTEIRADERMKGLYIILHTSLSGVFNAAMVEKVGANLFVPKFDADELAKAVLDHIQAD